jgi:FtsZ-interacting cell division protein ZipA
MEGLWAFVVIVGPIILLAVLVAGWLRNKRSRVPMEVTEAATRQNRRDDAVDDQARTPH